MILGWHWPSDSVLTHPSLHQPAIQNAGLAAVRSPNLNLDTEKLLKELDEKLPDQATELLRFHQQYLDGYPQQLKSYSVSIN